jgi:tellurite resistance protein TerC
MNGVILWSVKKMKRLIIGVIGFTILLIGIAMIVLPGPAFIVIPIGLGILATEFVWARSLLKKVKQQIGKK